MLSLRFPCCIVCFVLSAILASSQAASSAPTSPAQMLQARNPRYRVAPSDVLSVSFPLSPELNQPQVTVQPDGFITLPNVGSVFVQGQTSPEIVETLRKSYAKILHDPIIGVDLTNFQSAQFTIFGQVAKPGQYQLRYDTTLSQAIAIGGGFSSGAKGQAFLLRRVSPDLLEVKRLNVKGLVHGKNLSEDVQLLPGDMIYVPEAFISKFRRYIPYAAGIGVSPYQIVSSF